MNPIKSVTAILIALFIAFPAMAQENATKIGSVNMQKLMSEYYKTKELAETFRGYEKGIKEKDQERIESIKALMSQLQEIRTKTENEALPREKKDELFREGTKLNQEMQMMQNERIEWMNTKRAAFNEKQKVEFGVLRKEIMAMVSEVAEASDYDLIFDSSGQSGASVAILSYSKDAADLTGKMLARINRDAPKEDEDERAE